MMLRALGLDGIIGWHPPRAKCLVIVALSDGTALERYWHEQADRFGSWDKARLADLGRRIEAAKARRT